MSLPLAQMDQKRIFHLLAVLADINPIDPVDVELVPFHQDIRIKRYVM